MTWGEYTRKAQKEQKAENRFVTPDGVVISSDPIFLKANPEAMTWDEYTRQHDPNYEPSFFTPDGVLIARDRHYLRKVPESMTWEQYTQMHLNGQNPRSSTPASPKKVDQNVVDDAVKDLKELMGREPTAKEVEDFLNDMAEQDAT